MEHLLLQPLEGARWFNREVSQSQAMRSVSIIWLREAACSALSTSQHCSYNRLCTLICIYHLFFLNNCTCKEVISYIQPWSAISCSDLVLGHGDWRAGPLSLFRSQLKAGEMCFSSDVLSAPSVQSVTYVTKWWMHAMVPVGLSPQDRCLWAFLYHLFFSQGTSVMKWLRSHQLTANFGGMCSMWLYSLRGSDVPYQKKTPHPNWVVLAVCENKLGLNALKWTVLPFPQLLPSETSLWISE